MLTPPDIRDLLGDQGRGPGDDFPGDGDGGGDDGNGDLPNPPDDHEGDDGKAEKTNARAKGPRAPVLLMGAMGMTLNLMSRRMIKFLGGSFEPKSDDKPKVKEADTSKFPAFPLAETYRNWRIKTREAVVAASTDPDNDFKRVSGSWKETQTREALRKVAPLPLLMQSYTFSIDSSHYWGLCTKG